MAHVNLMADTVIANLPPDGLRAVVRSLLATNSAITPEFEQNAKLYLQRTANASSSSMSSENERREWLTSEDLKIIQGRIRAMLGCGLCFESLSWFKRIIRDISGIQLHANAESQGSLVSTLASLDGDLVQAVTAIEKVQSKAELSETENEAINELFNALTACQHASSEKAFEFFLPRGLTAIASLLWKPSHDTVQLDSDLKSSQSMNKQMDPIKIESFNLKGASLPRLFSGLWQLASPSWGSASKAEIFNRFSQHVHRGFTAYDMADHYGDAEILFGEFRRAFASTGLFAGTKLCIFQKVQVTPALINDMVTERCRRLQSKSVDLLQFHWQYYEDHQYIEALRLLQADERISLLGLCNFDSERLEEILAADIDIVSNQVQFSLIDSRPIVRMGKICEEYGIKLLTYGTLCGGFLAEKWLNETEPEIYSDGITPSQRKYIGMINIWGGWSLFQELLQSLKVIADKHSVSISNVATRWVLDFPYVGAVLVGVRMGVQDHADANLASYNWHLDSDDQSAIEQVLRKSKRDEVFSRLGDCGGEYRM